MNVYLDHNATTPLHTRVREAMLPYLNERFGNPSSLHRYGRVVRAALDEARNEVAALVGAHASQVVFTSGATEANNMVVHGVAAVCLGRRHVQVGATEHPSVMDAALALGRRGWRVSVLPVDGQGRIQGEALRDLARPDEPGGESTLVSVMLANNETGVVQDLAPVVAAARRANALVHTDAVQAVGKISVDFAGLGVDFLTLSAHKMSGPKGAGALIHNKAIEWEPLLRGGGQERGLRAGTENVAAIVGFGVAARLAREGLADHGARLLTLRAHLEAGLRDLGGVEVFAEQAPRLPNTVCFGVDGMDGEALVMGLDRAGYAVSSGSACASGRNAASPVLLAMGVEPRAARGAVRVSLGAGNSEREIDAFLAALAAALGRLRQAG